MKIFTFDEACRPAMASVTARLRERPQWQAELRCGKTLGVLLYEGGFLAAFSGTLGGQTRQEGFVPPVFDLMQPGSWFLEEEAAISAINARLDVLGHPASEATEEECRLRCERKHGKDTSCYNPFHITLQIDMRRHLWNFRGGCRPYPYRGCNRS